jgi:hypothetical protein
MEPTRKLPNKCAGCDMAVKTPLTQQWWCYAHAGYILRVVKQCTEPVKD